MKMIKKVVALLLCVLTVLPIGSVFACAQESMDVSTEIRRAALEVKEASEHSFGDFFIKIYDKLFGELLDEKFEDVREALVRRIKTGIVVVLLVLLFSALTIVLITIFKKKDDEDDDEVVQEDESELYDENDDWD
jgi:hypothetical protein